jgi:sulfur-oxidizing protein SoxY
MRPMALLARRRLLQAAAALLPVGFAAPRAAFAQADVFDARTFADALAALGSPLVPSADILLDLPDVADDGAAVPLAVSTRLPGVREILILVDGNPQPVAARFVFPAGTEPYVATRIRMAGSGTVVAAVRCEGGLFAAMRTTQVSVGGCG